MEAKMYRNVDKLDEALRAEADRLLLGKGLHSLLEKYGQVHLTGSYALKLMVWRDLDIYLVAEELPVSEFFRLGGQIADLLSPTKMSFRNERVARTEGLPEGLYWGIYLGNERAGAWKIDLWAINPEQFIVLDEFYKEIERRLTASSRLKILQIKSQCWMKPGYRRTFSSRDIYDAVLAEGVDDLDAFDAYLQRVKGCTLKA
jgi:hypothetical protein